MVTVSPVHNSLNSVLKTSEHNCKFDLMSQFPPDTPPCPGLWGGSRHVLLFPPGSPASPAPRLWAPSHQGLGLGCGAGKGWRSSLLLARLRGCVSALQTRQLVKASCLFPVGVIVFSRRPRPPFLRTCPLRSPCPVKPTSTPAGHFLLHQPPGIRWDLQLLCTTVLVRSSPWLSQSHF